MRRLFALGVLAGGLTLGATGQTLSLEEALQTALAQNFDIRIARQAEALAANDAELGTAGLLPRVSLNGNGGRTVNQILRQGNPAERPYPERNNVANENFGANLALSWTVFDGLQGPSFYRRFQLLLDNSTLQTRLAAEQVVADVTNAYYAIVWQQEQLRLLEFTVEISEERARLAQARKAVGSGSGLEALQSAVDLNTDRSALVRQRAAYERARVDLNELLGRLPTATDIPSDTTIALDTTLVLGRLQAQAESQNRTLANLQQQLALNTETGAQLAGVKLPTLNLVGSYNFGSSLSDPFSRFFNTTALYSETWGYNLGLQASWVIFDGFANRRALRANRIQHETLQLQQEQTQLQVSADLTRAYIDYRNNLELVALESQNTDVARQNAGAALERYRVGVSTPLELREAQVAFVDAQGRLLTARYQAKLAETELLRLSGALPAE